jgi:hypothetical protein
MIGVFFLQVPDLLQDFMRNLWLGPESLEDDRWNLWLGPDSLEDSK